VRIGQSAVIGANSVVLDDVPDHAVAVGSPARVLDRAQSVASVGP
jgi:serine acetyltransferase